MARKLYRVTFEPLTLYVIARSKAEARDVARENAREELRNLRSPAISHVGEITRPQDVDREWRGAIPWGEGNDEDLTTAEWLRKNGDQP